MQSPLPSRDSTGLPCIPHTTLQVGRQPTGAPIEQSSPSTPGTHTTLYSVAYVHYMNLGVRSSLMRCFSHSLALAVLIKWAGVPSDCSTLETRRCYSDGSTVRNGSMRVNRRFSMSVQSWTLGHLAGGIRITAYSQEARHCLKWWLTIRVGSFALSKGRVIRPNVDCFRDAFVQRALPTRRRRHILRDTATNHDAIASSQS